MNRYDKNQKGIVMITTVILLLTIAFIGASLMLFYYSVNFSAQTRIDEAKAFYLAEAGISYAIFQMRTQAQSLGYGEEALGPMILGSGSYTVEIDYAQSIITSIGEVNGVQKKLQLQFKTL
ncbi:hypothetical protein IID04_04455 [PVC group bacterium]|nr:hypothetical protein [PVC group bacterium]